MKHQHKSKMEFTRGFSGPVTTRDENPAAHGGVCCVEMCECGYVRRTNINGPHSERGAWRPGDGLIHRRKLDAAARLDAAKRLGDREERRRRLARGEPTWRGPHRTMTVRGVDALAVWVRIEAWDRRVVDVSGCHPHAEDRVITIKWSELRSAATQQDRGMSAAYEQILLDAEALAEGARGKAVALKIRGASQCSL